jgi:hypothetical protein
MVLALNYGPYASYPVGTADQYIPKFNCLDDF